MAPQGKDEALKGNEKKSIKPDQPAPTKVSPSATSNPEPLDDKTKTKGCELAFVVRVSIEPLCEGGAQGQAQGQGQGQADQNLVVIAAEMKKLADRIQELDGQLKEIKNRLGMPTP